MSRKKRANQSIATALAFILAATMCMPTVAWGAGDDPELEAGIGTVEQQPGDELGTSTAQPPESLSNSGEGERDDMIAGDQESDEAADAIEEPTRAASSAVAEGAVSAIGPLRVYYALDEGGMQEIGSSLNDDEKCVLNELRLDPETFSVVHLRFVAADGFSFEANAGSQITSVSLSWQAVTTDGMTLSYGVDLRQESGALVCDIPSSLLRNISNGEYERFAISWTTDGASTEIHGSAVGSYLGYNLFASGEAAMFESDSLMGTYYAEDGTAIVLAASGAGRTIAIADEVTSSGLPAISAFKDVAIACDSFGTPYRTEVDVNYSASVKFALGVDGGGNRTLTSLGSCTYRTASGSSSGSISEGQVFTQAMAASVGEATYPTLQGAIDAAQSGDVVSLLRDVQENVVVASGKDIALDLKGKTVAGRVDSNGKHSSDTVIVEGKLTVRDSTATDVPEVSSDYRNVTYSAGKILGSAPTTSSYAKALHVQNGGVVVIESGIVESQDSDAAFVSKGSSLTVRGGYLHSAEYGIGVEGKDATLEMSGGVIVAENNAAIGGNGTEGDEYGDTTIHISGGTIISRITTDGYIACGIYHPQRGDLSISGGTVYADGGVGILLRGGTLEMTDGSVIATGTKNGWVGDPSTKLESHGILVDGASGYYDSANSKVSISGGLVKADASVSALNLVEPGLMTVSGGTFTTDVKEYLAAGRIVKENSDGLFVVENDQVATVTKTDGTTVPYSTLSAAINKVKDGEVITLLKDVPVGNVQYQISRSIVLDLNGHSINSTKYATVFVNKYQGPIDVTIKNGTIFNSTDGKGDHPFGTAIQVRQDVNLTLENTVLDTSSVASDAPSYGVRVGLGTTDSRNPHVTIKGSSTRVSGSNAGVAVIGSNASALSALIIEDGVIEGGDYGIVGNGECDGTSIEVRGGTVSAKNEDGFAVYHPQNGNLTISGGMLTGANGVQFCGSGSLDVTGGSIEATAAVVVPNPNVSSASISDGAALSLVSRGGGYGSAGSAEVSVSGGSLTSVNNAALQEYAADGVGSLVKSLSITQANDKMLSVVGGFGKPAVSFAALAGDAAKAISGGTFSADPGAYCAPGYQAVDNGDGTYGIADVREAAIGDVKYVTLADALGSAKDGDTITLLRDVDTSDRLRVGKNISLDLGGNTYTGSNASGLFSVVNCALTVRNGTLVSTDAKSTAIYVQNASLELSEGASIKAAGCGVQVGNLYNTTGYRGDCVINNGASIEAADGCGVYVVGYYASGEAEDGSLSDAQNVRNTLTINGGTVKVTDDNKYAAVSGNGSNHGTRIVVNGGTISGGANNVGIYHPQLGELIVNGGIVEGATGIEMRAGSLDVSEGAHITGTSVPTSVNPNGSGATTVGAGVAIAQHSTKLPIRASISGGEIAGFSALYESNPQGNSAADLAKVTLSVTGGTFSAISGGTVAAYSEDFTNFITGGTFDTVIDAAYYDGGLYAQNAQGAAANAGAVVPRAYAISYDLAGGSLAEGAENPVSYTYFDDDIALSNPTRVGYTFAGWTGTGLDAPSKSVAIAKGSKGDRSYTATWTANEDTAYKVEHYFQDVEGDGYVLDASKTQALVGTTDAQTEAAALAANGFTAKAFEQAKIAADGSTVVKVYYDRNVHTVSYAYAGTAPAGASALPGSQTYRYGAPVVAADAATAPGYSFNGWGISEGYTMPDEDVVLTGSFTARGDTKYTVEHYQQALDGTYSLAETENLTGATDSAATAAPKAFAGFAYNKDVLGSLASGNIEGDGSLVLKLYYDRNSYEVTYAYAGAVPAGATAVPAVASVKYGERVTPAAAPSLTGYDFSGWSRVEAFDMPAENVSITGFWTAKSDVGYTVHYYLDGTTQKLADDATVEGRTFAQVYSEKALAIEGYTVKGASTQSVTLDAYDKEVTFFYTADEARIVFETNGGSKVDDLVGSTGAPVQGSLPAPMREGYAFAGWFADKALTAPVAQLPDTYVVGTTTYYAKWNAVPLPDADVEIQVEVPQPVEEGSAYVAVPDEAVRAAAEHAQGALESIRNGGVPAGMSAQDAQAVADVLQAAGSDDAVSVVVSLKFEEKDEVDIDEGEQRVIAGVANEGEGVALYLDLGVEMTVRVTDDSGVKDLKTVQLGEVDAPLLFEIHVDSTLIQGKHVRIAHVHNGVTEIIYPESVDREQGVVRFYASKFSTYALMTSETVTVTFESNGGTAVQAQALKLGEKAVKPADPTRGGFAFGGWFSDEGLAQAYDFAAPVERSMTLYAKWMAIGGGGPGSEGDGEGDDLDDTIPAAKPLPPAQTAKKLAPTGDGMGWVVTSAAVLVALAGATIVVAAIRRRSRH